METVSELENDNNRGLKAVSWCSFRKVINFVDCFELSIVVKIHANFPFMKRIFIFGPRRKRS